MFTDKNNSQKIFSGHCEMINTFESVLICPQRIQEHGEVKFNE